MSGPLSDGDAALSLRKQSRPLRLLRRRRRRFASLCFLLAGGAFGTALYLLRTRGAQVLDGRSLPVMLALVAVMAALFVLGASAESDVTRLEEEIAAIDDEIGRPAPAPFLTMVD